MLTIRSHPECSIQHMTRLISLGGFTSAAAGCPQGNMGLFKIDRLFPDYVTRESAGKDTVHFTLTEKGHRLVEQVLKGKR